MTAATHHPAPTGEIGRARTRVEDERLVTGHGRFVDDVHLPGTLSLAFVRSPYPHARIRRLDTEAASRAPGVVAVVTGHDVPRIERMPIVPVAPNPKVPPYEPLAREIVRHVGTPVAAVAAETWAQAVDAAALVEVEYEPLEAVSEPQAALAEGAPLVWPEFGSNVCYRMEVRAGDPDAAFASAHRTVSLQIAYPRLAAAPLEPRGVVASYDKGSGELTAWITTQTPNGTRDFLAMALDLPEHRVRVIAADMGGGFGSRSPDYPEYTVAAVLARRLGRPVRAVNTRSEDIATSAHGRASTVHVEAATDADGRVTALRARVVANVGAFLYRNGAVVPPLMLMMLPGCYQIANLDVEAVAAFTHTNPVGTYRGAGRPEAADTIERVMDAVARELALDPVELRRRQFIAPEQFPYKTATGHVYDSGRYETAMDAVLALSDFRAHKARQAAERARGERTLLGVGLATFVESSASGWESGHVRVEASGRITATTGSSAHGQGHETAFAQILSDRLGVPFERIAIRRSDTSITPPGIGTFGSRSAVVGGTALLQAADQVVAKAKRIAAGLLEASAHDVQVADGRFQIAGAPDKSVTWAQVAAVTYGRGRLPPDETLGLEATAYFTTPASTFGFGASVAVVRIDPDTGQVKVEGLWVVDDCGNVINPLLVEGQVQGGVAQGYGQALLEQVIYEPDGSLTTGSFMHYAVPRATDMPPLVREEMVTPSPRNPLGVKGVGEVGPIIGTAPIMNAVADALEPLGIKHLDMPYTAERVWAALQRAQADRQG